MIMVRVPDPALHLALVEARDLARKAWAREERGAVLVQHGEHIFASAVFYAAAQLETLPMLMRCHPGTSSDLRCAVRDCDPSSEWVLVLWHASTTTPYVLTLPLDQASNAPPAHEGNTNHAQPAVL